MSRPDITLIAPPLAVVDHSLYGSPKHSGMEAATLPNADAFDEFVPSEGFRLYSRTEQYLGIIQQFLPWLSIIAIQNCTIE